MQLIEEAMEQTSEHGDGGVCEAFLLLDHCCSVSEMLQEEHSQSCLMQSSDCCLSLSGDFPIYYLPKYMRHLGSTADCFLLTGNFCCATYQSDPMICFNFHFAID